MRIDGAAFANSTCGGSTAATQYCTIPSELAEGPHTGEIRCLGAGTNGEDVPYTKMFSFVVDKTPPTLEITEPLPNSVQPAINFRAAGTSDGNGVDLNVGGILRTVAGVSWSVNLSSTDFQFVLAQSTAGLVPTFVAATTSDGVNSTNKFVSFFVDGKGPELSILAPVGVFTSLVAISGTVKDDSGVASVKVSIIDSSSGLSWNPSSNKFDSPVVVESNVPVDVNVKGQNVSWAFTSVTDRHLVSPRIYTLSVVAVDAYGNKTTVTSALPFFRPVVQQTLAAVALGGTGTATFNPPSSNISWGGIVTQDVCVQFSSAVKAIPNWQTHVSARAHDGAVTAQDEKTLQGPFPPFNNGFCPSDQMQLRIRSRPTSCLRQPKVSVYFKGSIIGQMNVAIDAPTKTVANRRFNTNLGGGINPAIECQLAGVAPPCRYDVWRLIADGTFNTLQTGVRFFENHSAYSPLVFSGARLKMCPFTTTTFTLTPKFLNIGYIDDDSSGYDGSDVGTEKFANCGESSTQGIVFVSNHNNAGVDAKCEFVSGISKTKRLDGKGNIFTKRKDAANAIDRP